MVTQSPANPGKSERDRYGEKQIDGVSGQEEKRDRRRKKEVLWECRHGLAAPYVRPGIQRLTNTHDTRYERERDLERSIERGRESTRRKKKLRREEEKEEGDEEEEEEEEEKEVLCKSDGHIAKFHAAWFEDRFNG